MLRELKLIVFVFYHYRDFKFTIDDRLDSRGLEYLLEIEPYLYPGGEKRLYSDTELRLNQADFDKLIKLLDISRDETEGMRNYKIVELTENNAGHIANELSHGVSQTLPRCSGKTLALAYILRDDPTAIVYSATQKQKEALETYCLSLGVLFVGSRIHLVGTKNIPKVYLDEPELCPKEWMDENGAMIYASVGSYVGNKKEEQK